MEQLIQFNHDFIIGQIPVHEQYWDHGISQKNDVVTDLTERHMATSAACLSIAKQIVVAHRMMTITIPRNGDLFLGIQHHPVIRQVNFVINNYTEEITIEGQLVTYANGSSLWLLSSIPILLSTIDDYAHVNLSAQIEVNQQYNLQRANQDCFKAYYGYLHPDLMQQMANRAIYQYPLNNPCQQLVSVCGIFSVREIKAESK
jgi:hypothetical protein|uniref:Uncharacterized protein n=1 Tax=viral metagenome TaxID=1070528 RepID=A0A6C0BKS2_9ZZZZ